MAILSPALFRALADPGRVELLARLSTCCSAKTVSEIATWVPQDISVVSRHLACLRDAGVLEATKRGKEVLYVVNTGALAATLRRIADALEACCPVAPNTALSPSAATTAQRTKAGKIG